jgi:F-type H+-transporting ATPase subunit b
MAAENTQHAVAETAQTSQDAHETAVVGHDASAKPDVLGTLGINLPLFLAQLVNVAIILVVLRMWVFKPLGKLLEERRAKIEAGLANAVEADKRLVSAKEQEDAVVAEARAEARKIVEDSRAMGEQARAAQVEQAKRDVDAQVEEAKAKIQTERSHALEAVRRETAELVVAATRKVSASSLDDKAHRAAVEQAIKELEQAAI